MENQNSQTQGQPQVGAPETHDVAFPAPANGQPIQPQPMVPVTPISTPAPSLPEKKSFKALGGNLFEKYKSAPKNIKFLVTVGLVFFVLIFLLTIAVLIKNMAGGNGKAVAPIATPTAAPTTPLTQVEITNPSRYATDSAVLKIETDVDGLSKEMDGVDLRQSNLRVPTLDFNIKFQ